VYNELYGEVEKIAAPLITAGENIMGEVKKYDNLV
jgi:hypothetical protein